MCRIGFVLVILSLMCVQEIYSDDILDYPYMAAVFWLQEGAYKFHCNGAIISSRHVLTTATCAGDAFESGKIKVRVGSSNHLYGGQENLVARLNKHYKLSPDLDADIAVLTLLQPLKLSSRVAVVNLPDQNFPTAEILVSKVLYYYHVRHSEDYVRTLYVSGVSSRMNSVECNNFYTHNKLVPGKDLVTENMICLRLSSDPNTRIFGAPLVINGTIYGIFSWDRKGNFMDAPFIFTRVFAFTKLIKDWIK